MFVIGCIDWFKRLLLSRGVTKGVLISERDVLTAEHPGGQPIYSLFFVFVFVFVRPKIWSHFFSCSP